MQDYTSASTSIVNNPNAPSIRKTIFRAGLVAGVFDIIAAIVTYITMAPGKNPVTIFNYIASGVFGKESAFVSGWTMPLFGLAFHFIIAFIWAITFFLFYPYLNKIVKNKWLAGILYGILVWTIMNTVVVPLSNTPKNPMRLNSAIIGVLTLIVLIGIPISLITDYYFRQLKYKNLK